MTMAENETPKPKGWNTEPQTFTEMTAQRLSRLNPPSVWPTDVGGGGVPETLPAELAMALAHSHPAVHQLIVAKYVRVNSERAQAQTFYPIWGLVMDMKITDKWPHGPKGKHWYRNLTTLVILELTEPNLCSHCGGAGVHAVNGRDCGACGGVGKYVMGDVERAQALEIPFSDWKNGWRDRYEKIYRRVSALEHLSLAIIGRQLRRVPV